MFKRLFNKVHEGSPLDKCMGTEDRFVEGIQEYFLVATTWGDCRSVLEKCPELLDEERSAEILNAIAWMPDELQSRAEQRLDVLERCRDEGVDSVFRKLVDDLHSY